MEQKYLCNVGRGRIDNCLYKDEVDDKTGGRKY